MNKCLSECMNVKCKKTPKTKQSALRPPLPKDSERNKQTKSPETSRTVNQPVEERPRNYFAEVFHSLQSPACSGVLHV